MWCSWGAHCHQNLGLHEDATEHYRSLTHWNIICSNTFSISKHAPENSNGEARHRICPHLRQETIPVCPVLDYHLWNHQPPREISVHQNVSIFLPIFPLPIFWCLHLMHFLCCDFLRSTALSNACNQHIEHGGFWQIIYKVPNDVAESLLNLN
jgi:hypothetical protein